MDAKTQRKVLDLFDEGKLPQQIVDELAISMLEVVESLKARLRIEDNEVEPAAIEEILKKRAVMSISDRLSAVDESTPSAADWPRGARWSSWLSTRPTTLQQPAMSRSGGHSATWPSCSCRKKTPRCG